VTTLIGATIISILMFFMVAPSFVAPYDPDNITPDVLIPPNDDHILGTDPLGRDILSRIVYGTRMSFQVAFVAVILAMAIGVPLGSISGYFGGKIDKLLTLPVDSLYAFPTMLTALTVAFVLGAGATNTGIAIAIGTIPTFFRIARSIVVSVKELTFVEAERLLGAGDLYIIFRHLLPHVIPSVLVLATISVSRALLVGAGLGFLGVGVPPPTAEWGADLNVGRSVLASGIWWPTTFPGLMIFISSIGFNLLGEGMNVILSPKFRVR
jgi:peptide/nickel transport system permease protein